VLIGALGLLPLAAAIAADGDPEVVARRIEARLMAPCCMTNTVAVHESGTALAMRAEIRELLAAGRSEREVLDHFVARYGPQILALPEARGIALAPYLAPFALMLLATAGLALAFRRWRRADRAAPHQAVPTPIPGPWAERLQNELDQLD
jgi:cytochrome c-type biogenesis protein CcmH